MGGGSRERVPSSDRGQCQVAVIDRCECRTGVDVDRFDYMLRDCMNVAHRCPIDF